MAWTLTEWRASEQLCTVTSFEAIRIPFVFSKKNEFRSTVDPARVTPPPVPRLKWCTSRFESCALALSTEIPHWLVTTEERPLMSSHSMRV